MSLRESIRASVFNPLAYPVAFELPQFIPERSAWMGHLPLGMTLTAIVRPRLLVELGTYTGVSFMGFCQAVHRLRLDTRCYAVDTWRGDDHTGQYDESILLRLAAYNEANYNGFSRLLRMTFDEALPYFADGSVDLLHIDGLHTYEAVRHDFESWQPKLSERGVVLFHDINVREREFGVWRLWDELKGQYPSFEVYNDHGLGMLAVGPDAPPPILALCQLETDEATAVRAFFAGLAGRIHGWAEQERLKGEVAQAAQTTEQFRQWHAIALADADNLRARVQQFEADWQALEQANLSLLAQVQAQGQQLQQTRDLAEARLAEVETQRRATIEDLDQQRLTAFAQSRVNYWRSVLYARELGQMTRVFGLPHRLLRKGVRIVKRIARPDRSDLWNAVAPSFMKLRDDTMLFMGHDSRWKLQASEDLSPPGTYVSYRWPTPPSSSISGLQFAVLYTGEWKDGAIGIEIVADDRIVAQRLQLLDPLDLSQPVTLTFPPVMLADHRVELRVFAENISGDLRIFELRRSLGGKLLRRPFLGVVLV